MDRQYQLAVQIYELLAKGTFRWPDATGQHRHAGRFYADTGTARPLLGNVNRARIAFSSAAEEDKLISFDELTCALGGEA